MTNTNEWRRMYEGTVKQLKLDGEKFPYSRDRFNRLSTGIHTFTMDDNFAFYLNKNYPNLIEWR